ncbi:MAG: AAA family ATPase [Candidatus Cloacimonetes bacterium]|jgi:ATP-dependent Lon protease|nr:AAA family ATPase [Candidatus Cloacimonadota bacterium]
MPTRRTKQVTPSADRLPVLPLRSTVVYPFGVIGVQIGIPSTLEMLSAYPQAMLIAAFVVAPGEPDDPFDPRSLEKVGVRVRVSDRLNMPGGTVQATVQGLERIILSDVVETNGYFTAHVEPAKEIPAPDDVAQDLIARILTVLEPLADEVERVPREVPRILRMNLADPGRFADLVATLTNFTVAGKDQVLQLLDIRERLQYAYGELDYQLDRVRKLQAERDAARAAEAEAAERGEPAEHESPADRAQALRRRIKMLQSELGEVDPVEREVIDFLRRIEAADLPARVAAEARTEIERLRTTPTGPDASEIRTYVDWLVHLPWRSTAAPPPEEIDLARVQKALDDALLGLEEPKERLLDQLAVARLRGDLVGPVPCIVGPPYVGKSSLVRALAEGLGRPLASLELGGRGESQIVGTRRARVGAEPGKIIAALRDVGVRDPLFHLEQMDEIGLGKVDGDPIEALEETLEWQNRPMFVDNYIGMPFDLTSVLFVATASDFYRIPRDLRELMAEIRIAGYTPEEKTEIARKKLLPRLVSEHGLSETDVVFPDDAIDYLAYGYARDSGLGTMIRSLQTLLRTRARAKAQGDLKRWKFGPERIEDILGLPRYTATPAESRPEVGVVTGLAWTAAGGELMFIEALRMPGNGRLIITGLLGDVMRESVNAAYSYVRSRGESLGIDEETFRESDVHVHFPVGAIPKDGPSAGIAVTLAVASSLSNRPVRHDIAMSGEVTLRGKVLEIGGVKEKVLAAHRAGIEEVILPVNNERDLRDVPEDVRNSIRFHFVDRMEEVVALALYNGGNGRRPGIRAAASTNEAKKPAAKKSAAGKSAARKRKKPPAKRK